jgi:hypothetical protein
MFVRGYDNVTSAEAKRREEKNIRKQKELNPVHIG